MIRREFDAMCQARLLEPDVEDLARWARSVDEAVGRSEAAREGRGFKFELPESLRAA
jgi:hypothetical protein